MLDLLVSGALSPTTARMVAKHLTPENHQEPLAAAAGRSKQEVERLLAGRFPQPDVATLVRRLPVREVASASASTAFPAIATEPAQRIEGRTVPVPDPRPFVRPLSEERYVVRFTASAATREKLRRAQDLLGHAVPSGDLAEVFDRALTLLLEDLERRKLGAVGRPRVSAGQPEASRNVPAEVRRAVVRRDAGRCAFVAPDGRRCGERRCVEFHHVHPYWAGGKATVENIQLRCRAHNRYEAELFYESMYIGADFVKEPAGLRLQDSTRSGTG